MAGYRLTARADADLSAIYEYSIVNFGLERARTYLQGLGDAFESLVENPRMGLDCGHIKHGHRRHTHVSHSIYYRLHDQGIEVLRVLHASQDPLRHLQ